VALTVRRRSLPASPHRPRSGLRAHPVVGNEVVPSKLQELTVGRVIHRLDTHHARGNRWRMRLEVLEELKLGRGRANDQDFASVLDRIRDRLIVRMVFWRVPGAYDAAFVVQMLMPRFRMDDTFFCVVRIEFDNVRFAVVNPHNAMIMAHGVRGLSDRRRQVYAAVWT